MAPAPPSARGSAAAGGDPPVLIVSCHRAGASDVARLLSTAAGLDLGDLMPSSPAHCSFEATGFVKAHNDLLASLDRDWTCPPAAIEPAEVSTVALAGEIQRAGVRNAPWGVKDPRLLHLLTVWASLLPAVRVVGVVRSHEDVVRSLRTWDRVEAAAADALTRSSARRLAALRDHAEFPIIDVSRGDLVGQTKGAAMSLGLEWDGAIAATLAPAMSFRQRSIDILDNPDIQRLQAYATGDVTSATVDSSTITTALGDLPTSEPDLDRYCGPRAVARRAAAWRAVPRSLDAVIELSRNLDVAGSANPSGARGRTFQCRDLTTMYDILRTFADPADALVLPDIASWVRHTDLEAALDLAASHVATDGVVVIGLSRADRDTRAALEYPPVAAETLRAAAHQVDLVELPVASGSELDILRFVKMPTGADADDAAAAANSARLRLIEEPREAGDPWETRYADVRSRYDRLIGRRSVRIAVGGANGIGRLRRMATQLLDRARPRDRPTE